MMVTKAEKESIITDYLVTSGRKWGKKGGATTKKLTELGKKAKDEHPDKHPTKNKTGGEATKSLVEMGRKYAQKHNIEI
jgi:hypothetical protein